MPVFERLNLSTFNLYYSLSGISLTNMVVVSHRFKQQVKSSVIHFCVILHLNYLVSFIAIN